MDLLSIILHISTPKSNGKTELAGMLAVYGLLDLETSPIIPVVASSYDQADLVFGSAKAMIQMVNLDTLLIFKKERS